MLKKMSKSWLVAVLLVALLVMGANDQGLKEQTGVTLLSRTTGVPMGTNNTKANLFTFPKPGIVTRVVIRNLSGAVACGTDNDFGAGATAAGWKDTVNLSTVDATDDYYQVTADDVRIEAVFAAADIFGIQTDVQSDASAVTATVEVYGILFD